MTESADVTPARDRERRQSMTIWPTVAAITIACVGVTAIGNWLLYQFGGSPTWRRAAGSCAMIWLAFAAASVVFGVPVALRCARQPAPYIVIALLSMCVGLLAAALNAFAGLVVSVS